MTFTVLNTDIAGSGTLISLSANSDILVTEDTTVVSSDGSAIAGTGGGNTVFVSGDLYGEDNVLDLLGDNNRIEIATTGSANSTLGLGDLDANVRIGGDDAVVINYGVISGGTALMSFEGLNATIVNSGTVTGQQGIVFESKDDGSHNISYNSGSIVTWGYGVVLGAASGSVSSELHNSGLLTSTGSDAVFGSVGDDQIYNTGAITGDLVLNGGNDVFDGRGGTVNGVVYGGLGDDTYLVDDATVALSESASQGSDTVQSESGWMLADNFEALTLLGDGHVTGAGNSADNVITGNGGNNLLYGLDGNDTLSGQAGDDSLRAGAGADVLDGDLGDDLLMGQRNNDTLSGGSGHDTLFGGRNNDTLNGDDGRDVLIGGHGRDVLTGGDDEDVFVFQKTLHSPDSSTRDTIKDFDRGQDLIDLTGIVSGELTFIGGAGFGGIGVAELQVTDNGSDAYVRVDEDGDGTADMRIDVRYLTTLSEADFLL